MKIVVFSDSHNILNPMRAAIDAEKPDMLLHLGDYVTDFNDITGEKYSFSFETKNVKGNCDWRTNAALKLCFNAAGKNIFMTHGHTYSVKDGLESLYFAALEAQADIALFGHTHRQFIKSRGGLTLINPGSIADGAYAVIRLENGEAQSELKRI